MFHEEKSEFSLRRVLVAAIVGIPVWGLLTLLFVLCPTWVSFVALFTGLVLFHTFDLGRKWLGFFGGLLMFSGILSAVLIGALK